MTSGKAKQRGVTAGGKRTNRSTSGGEWGVKAITEAAIVERLRTRPDGSLVHREQKDLEFKESFNLAGLAEYFRDFAGFANNAGGYIVFGVTDKPRRLKGLSASSLEQFRKIDEERISGFINEHFAPYVDWEMDVISIDAMNFGVLYAYRAPTKPIICKKQDDRGELKNGEVYYRYAGRTEVIGYSELANIIEGRIRDNNEQWLQKVKRIGEVGPANVGILNTASGVVETNNATLLIDKELIKQIQFIKEGHFNEKKGAKTLKLIGSVSPIGSVEIEKVIQKHLTDEYPYSYKKLESLVRSADASIKQNDIQRIIREGELKTNPQYSSYNFRNKDQKDEFERTRATPKGIPSIYNEAAVQYILKVASQG